jgi:hypothetical protein
MKELWTNRRALLVKAKPAFREWLVSTGNHGHVPDAVWFENHISVYLVDAELTVGDQAREVIRVAPRILQQELLMNNVVPMNFPDLNDTDLFFRFFEVGQVGVEGDLGQGTFRAGEMDNTKGCYCGLWDRTPEVLEARGVPRGFCGLCSVCSAPGHTRHHPGTVPFTGSWCDDHYADLASR